MRPVTDKHANSILRAPDGSTDVVDLPITRLEYKNGVTAIESCWELSDEELEIIKKTKKVYFICQGSTHPPILLQAKSELD